MRKNIMLLSIISILSLVSCDSGNLISIPKDNSDPSEEISTTELSSVIRPESNYTDIQSEFQISGDSAVIESSDTSSTSEATSDDSTSEKASGTTYTITQEGEYTLEGKLEEGQVVVNAPDKEVKLILNNVSLSNSTNSPIFIVDADKVIINSAEGTYNEIKDTRSLRVDDTEDDDTVGNGCIYAKCDLNIAGKGSLVVSSSYNNGIHTTKDLKIKNVTLEVSAPNNAIKGNDSIEIESGNITAISTGGDALKTTDTDISSKGNQRGTIDITGGYIALYAACDGIDAAYDVNISDEANVQIYTDKYSSYTGEIVESSTSELYIRVTASYYSTSYRFAVLFYNDEDDYKWADATYYTSVSGGFNKSYYYYKCDLYSSYTNVQLFRFDASQKENSYETYDAKSDGSSRNTSRDLLIISMISNGTIYTSWSMYNQGSSSQGGWGGGMGGGGNSNNTDYSCKGIKADNQINISGGSIFVKASDDAIHANCDATLENEESPLGNITISGGELTLYSLDDAIHADKYLTINGGTITVTSSYEGLEGNQIEINDGKITVYASDDAINAAGSYLTPLLTVNGGYVDATVGSGDVDGIDVNGNYVQTGGFVITRDSTSDSSGNASGLDIDGSAIITGGTIIVAGSIAETPASSSTNNWVLFGSSSGSSFGGGRPGGFGGGGRSSSSVTFAAGTYTITNTDISFTLASSYKGMWISSDQFTLKESYTLSNGTTSKSWTQSAKQATVSS